MNDATKKLLMKVYTYLTTQTKTIDDEADMLMNDISIRVQDATAEPAAMKFGVYRKLEGRTGVGMLYQFVAVSRNHTTGAESVIYIPLRVEPEWAGTVRHCDLSRAEFERRFEFVSEGLPA